MSGKVDVKRKKGERFDSLLRRFNRRVIDSGKILQARKIRYKKRNENSRVQKEAALRKLKMSEKREYMIKVGLLKEDPRRNRNRRR